MIYPNPKRMPRPDLRGVRLKASGSTEVTYPVSYRYNGGICIGNHWYPGFHVPPPLLPRGFKLVCIGVGLQLNARPPYATMLLQRK